MHEIGNDTVVHTDTVVLYTVHDGYEAAINGKPMHTKSALYIYCMQRTIWEMLPADMI
jgi:hypothetical protein